MRRFPLSVLAACGVALMAAAVTPALARDGRVHVVTVVLPGGGVEQIRYTGDVAPRVVLVPSTAMVPAFMVAAPSMASDPFATLERISALMDQEAAAMLRQVDAQMDVMPRMVPGLPQGASGYSFAATMSGNGVCTRSVQITYLGDAAAKMVSSTSGDCGAGHGSAAPVEVNRPDPAPRPVQPRLIEARAGAPTQVAWNR